MTWSVQVVVTPVPTAADPANDHQRPLGLLTFDITFIGNVGYEDLPQLVIPAGQVINANKTVVNPTTSVTAVIQKESSPEFRVNPEVPVNPFQLQPDECSGPAVAMDADGGFRDHLGGRSVRSGERRQRHRHLRPAIRAGRDGDPGRSGPVAGGHEQRRRRQRRSQRGVDPSDPSSALIAVDPIIQGVRPVQTPVPYNALLPADLQVPGDVYTFRVNTNTANAQGQPSVAMDNAGNFVIAWANERPDVELLQQRSRPAVHS